MLKFIIIFTISYHAFGYKLKNYKDARKQNILEYTVFGIDECLKINENKFVVSPEDLTTDKILVGSANYFTFLSKCFKEVTSTCSNEDSCNVKESMHKRIENVSYIDKEIIKLSVPK